MDNEAPRGVNDEWSTTPWRKLERYVYRLQKRMYVRHESRIPA